MTLGLVGVILPWFIVAIGCWIGLQLVRQNGRILLRLEALERRLAVLPAATETRGGHPAPAAETPRVPSGLAVGAAAPHFELPDLSGTLRSLGEWRGRQVLLVFFNPQCGYCIQMAPELAALSEHGDQRPLPLIVSTGDVEHNRHFMQQHGIRGPVLLQQQMEVAATYQVGGTPMGYLVREDGTIGSPVAVGARAVLDLAPAPRAEAGNPMHAASSSRADAAHIEHKGNRTLAESRINRNGLAAGTIAPVFRLSRVGGGELALEQYRGQRVLLVFSDPNCGPCDQLVPDLELLHRQRPDLQVLMVSRGSVDANQQKITEGGLTFPVVLQQNWEISRAYGMFATPIGYLIDERGIVAANVAVGAEAILGLSRQGAIAANEVLAQ